MSEDPYKSGTSGKRKWTPEEVNVVLTSFHSHVIGSTLPGKTECLKVISKNKCLKGRRWTNIKDYVRNHKKLASKKKSS